MTNAERATATRDEHYNLVSVLYHTLQEGDTLQQYIDDAQAAGDEELVLFFEDIQEQDRERGERGKRLLSARLDQTAA